MGMWWEMITHDIWRCPDIIKTMSALSWFINPNSYLAIYSMINQPHQFFFFRTRGTGTISQNAGRYTTSRTSKQETRGPFSRVISVVSCSISSPLKEVFYSTSSPNGKLLPRISRYAVDAVCHLPHFFASPVENWANPGFFRHPGRWRPSDVQKHRGASQITSIFSDKWKKICM